METHGDFYVLPSMHDLPPPFNLVQLMSLGHLPVTDQLLKIYP